MNKNDILIKKQYVVTSVDSRNSLDESLKRYMNAYLLSNFGIVLDRPELITKEMLDSILSLYRKTVPASFYKNPQDTKYYSVSELFLEQIVSYAFAYGEDNCHIELFKKELPQYVEGDEIKLRTFKVLTEVEAEIVLIDMAKNYAEYKRPWSIDESEEFKWLFANGYYDISDETPILCGDNAIAMLDTDINFGRFLFKKDLVKWSIQKYRHCKKGLQEMYRDDKDFQNKLPKVIVMAKNCPMSKSQAKYFNKLIKLSGVKAPRATNQGSPEQVAIEYFKKGEILKAAKVYAKNGTLLSRHIKMLLSRADEETSKEIIQMLGNGSPTALFQLMDSIEADSGAYRTFTFTRDHLVKRHAETLHEYKWRKSRLDGDQKKMLLKACAEKIEMAYKANPIPGKIFVDDSFEKIAVPVNTSATGKGIDVLPVGSRLPINGTSIRTFVHWENAFDIDASLILIFGNGDQKTLDFRNMSSKPMGNDILFSGDVTSSTGTEYYDIKLAEAKKRGIVKIIQSFHGYGSKLDCGEIYCGYQNKTNLDTKAWDPKNIEMKFHIKGDTRACMAFGLDLETNEVIVINQMVADEYNVVSTGLADLVEKTFNSLENLNMKKLIEWRAEKLVSSASEADIVFADHYMIDLDNPQKIVRPFDIEALAVIASCGKLN